MQPAEERSGSRLPFDELECRPEVRVAASKSLSSPGGGVNRSRQRAILPTIPASSERVERSVAAPVAKMMKSNVEGARLRFDCRDASGIAHRVPCAIGMPHEIFEPATTPKGILGWRLRKLLQDVAHESPALQVGQFAEVAEHAGEIHPHQRIDPGHIRAAEAKVDPCGTGFECRGRVVEGGSADAEHADALSRKPVEIYVIGRMGIELRREVGDEVRGSPPASVAFKAGCEHDLSRMDAFDPVCPTQMGEQKIAGRLDGRQLDLILDRKLENIAVPIEIFPP